MLVLSTTLRKRFSGIHGMHDQAIESVIHENVLTSTNAMK